MRHNYCYHNNKLKPLVLIILGLAFLVDLINIFLIATAILFPIVFLYIALDYLFFLALRVSTIYMTYKIEYTYYKGELNVTKTYFRKPYVFLSIKKSEIKDITLYNGEQNIKSLYSKTCLYDKYLVELSNGDKYILNLDDVLYSALTCEDKYDLFR